MARQQGSTVGHGSASWRCWVDIYLVFTMSCSPSTTKGINQAPTYSRDWTRVTQLAGGWDAMPSSHSGCLFLGPWEMTRTQLWCSLLSSTFHGSSLLIHNLKSSQPEKERSLAPVCVGGNQGLENLRNSPRVTGEGRAEPYLNPNLPCSKTFAPGVTPHCLSNSALRSFTQQRVV